MLWFAGAAAKLLDAFPPGAEERTDPGLAKVVGSWAGLVGEDYLDANAERAALGIRDGRVPHATTTC